jgi:hypothetical protein
MKTKQRYIAPNVTIVAIKTDGIMQSASAEIQVFFETETTTEDVQLSRTFTYEWDDE